MVEVDLTNLKNYKEKDWKDVVNTVPFLNRIPSYRDYTDGSNINMTTFVFKPRTFPTATQSAMTMLRTLNFMNKPCK